VRAREIIEEFPPGSMIDSDNGEGSSSTTRARAAADGATGLVGAALTSVTALSISAQRLARKNERARLEPAQKRIETQLHRCRT
jgi:hypothetical protein